MMSHAAMGASTVQGVSTPTVRTMLQEHGSSERVARLLHSSRDTIEELRSELGTAIPATVERLDRALAAHELIASLNESAAVHIQKSAR